KDLGPEQVSADGQTLVKENRHGFQLWDIATGQEIAGLRVEPSARVLALSSNGRTLLFQPRDEGDPAIRVWHVPTKKVVRRFTLPDDIRRDDGDDVRSAAFSPDGKVAALVVNG